MLIAKLMRMISVSSNEEQRETIWPKSTRIKSGFDQNKEKRVWIIFYSVFLFRRKITSARKRNLGLSFVHNVQWILLKISGSAITRSSRLLWILSATLQEHVSVRRSVYPWCFWSKPCINRVCWSIWLISQSIFSCNLHQKGPFKCIHQKSFKTSQMQCFSHSE